MLRAGGPTSRAFVSSAAAWAEEQHLLPRCHQVATCGPSRVISTESSTIIRSVGRTPQVGKPGWPCLRLWEHCSPSGRGPFPVAPRPLFPPSLCWAHKHPPGQVAFPKQLSSLALSRVIHNPCCGQSYQCSRPQRSPPRGSRAQSLQSWSCFRVGTLANLTPRQKPVLGVSQSIPGRVGPSQPNQQVPTPATPRLWCCATGVKSLPGTLLAPLLPARPTLHQGRRFLSPGEGKLWLAAQEGSQDPREQPQHKTRARETQ